MTFHLNNSDSCFCESFTDIWQEFSFKLPSTVNNRSNSLLDSFQNHDKSFDGAGIVIVGAVGCQRVVDDVVPDEDSVVFQLPH